MTKTVSQRTLTKYRIRGDWDMYPFEFWSANFGTAKAHQLISAGVLVEDIDDSGYDAGWTGHSEEIEIDFDNNTWEVKS